jgi:hypothetical protein
MKAKTLFSFFFLFVLTLNLSGQNNEQINVQVQASLKRGISVISQSTVLDFGEIILSNSQQTVTKSPAEGLRFKIISHPEKPVLIDYNFVQLSSNENKNGPIFVTKLVHTGSNSGYVNPIEVQPGTYYTPPNQNGEGVLSVWVGGSLIIDQSITQGDYSGTLVISIAY